MHNATIYKISIKIRYVFIDKRITLLYYKDTIYFERGEKMAVSEAQKKATAKYEKENYDKILTRFPKGTKDRILSTGAKSVNSFIIQAVVEKLGDKIPEENNIKPL